MQHYVETSLHPLIVTNVPYLGRGDHHPILMDWADRTAKDARADLATLCLSRCVDFLSKDGSLGIVSPQNWLFLASYRKFRKRLLSGLTWNLLAKLGEHGFESPSAAGAFVSLLILSARKAREDHQMTALDVSALPTPRAKAALLSGTLGSADVDEGTHYASTSVDPSIRVLLQSDQIRNPDSVVVTESLANTTLLADYADSVEGLSTGDGSRYVRCFWELPAVTADWEFFQGSPPDTRPYGGRESILFWERGEGSLQTSDAARVQGHAAWGRKGVIIGQMRVLKSALYSGHIHEKITAAIVPKDERHLPAIWAFCSSPDYNTSVRTINQKLSVATATLVKVPFDLPYWEEVAKKKCPEGLPKACSSDCTQWVFTGDVPSATTPLQVAVARLLDYCWPEQIEDSIDELVDTDGVVCISALGGERPAADRLRDVLTTAYGTAWSPSNEAGLLGAVGFSGRSLDEWLRDGFFEQHCQVFHQRPFIWHIWDGRRKDGFHALVNYHKLGRKLLEKLIYTHLGDWIARQKAAESRGESGAEARRLAAEDLQERLKLILQGESPYDIFVRWKPLEEQPIGWDPDLNDGVRINIRPFVSAGVLRKNPKIKWKKDRGKEPERSRDQYPWFWGWDEETVDFMGGPAFDGNRWNDCHYSNAVKRAARAAKQASKQRK